ncbi:hypothetical protein RhiirA1_458620 [Rhizophagus irregularis]|uniref:Uncharacterized protein n=1 Tax=Rhizophagus irregularis TaxID=588596 RepID=A0A2N0RVJ0_9GLOM|nr:hypothetical protein RhiirA1_458620 [Rhizophagus irregularis]
MENTNLNNRIIRDYSTGNPSIIDNNENLQHTSNPNMNLNTSHINNIDMTALASQNITFEFYLPLPNDTRIYHVTYTELNSVGIAQLLNNRINLSHFLNHRLPHHYNIQHLIRQEIVQKSTPQQSFDNMDIQRNFQEYSDNNAFDVSSILPIQQPNIQIIMLTTLPYHYNVQRLIRQEIVQQSIGYQQNTIPQQSLDTIDVQPIYQEYSDNTSACDVSSISPILQPVDYQQDAIPQQSFNTMDIQPTIQEYSDNNAYDASSVPPNSPDDTSTTSS